MFARAWLFVGHESQIPNPGDYLRLGHGRGIGDPVPRPRRQDPCLPEFVPASRHEGVPLRRGQHAGLHLPLPRLELRHGRQTGRRAVLPRGLPREARQVANGASSKSRNCATTRAPIWATWDPTAPSFLEYLGDFARYLDLHARRLGRQRGRHRDTRRHPEMADPVQLEIPGGEFLRRQLSQYQSPLGRSGRHRPQRQRPPRHAASARWPAACRSRSTTAAIRRAVPVAPRTSRCRPPTSTRHGLPNILRIAKKSGADTAANGPGSSAAPARFSRIRRCTRASRARLRCGTRAGRTRPKCGAGIWSTRQRRAR